MRTPFESARLFLMGGAALLALGSSSLGQRPAAKAPLESDAPDAEDRRERVAMERFLTLLEKNPRRGTALDRVYGYHVERGSLDAFIKDYETRVAGDPKDGVGWTILGLLESQRGRDAAAVTALRRAEATRPDDPMPSYYLGQAYVLVGQPEEAAAAFERALGRKPKRNEVLEIFQALGRVYQRTSKTKEAMAVWGRLEVLFPDDPRVREQIASALAEEGQAELALPRFESLAKAAKDPFRQAQWAMNAADLKGRLGRTEQALRDYESLLGKLRPDSWLYREVRRKIDEVFLRNDDQAGLASYYERWVKANPEDVEALVRLGRSLAAQGRLAESRTWYEKAIKLAPSRRELRQALIGQLVQEQKIADAAAQYEELAKAEPNNPDILRDWGGLLLRDTSKPEAGRKAEAAAIWRKLLDARPKDPVTVAQVGDLFRQAEMVDDALALYRRAIDLAPDNPQYREYLGEFLHTLKRPDEALAAWTPIAEGKNRDAKNLVRLAEVLAGFGYLKQALPPMTEAVALEGDDFNLRLKLAQLLHRAERFDDARVQLDASERLAENDEEKGAALEAQVKNDQAGGKMAERIEGLRKEVGGKDVPAARWARLARYLEADGKLPEASDAVARAIEADPRSVQAWTLAARVRESAGQLADAVDAYRRLADLDRRNRTEYLTGVAKLQARLGRADEALKAGRDLIAAAPGNPEHYEFFSSLCFQLGREDEGLDALRRAVRVNPNEIKVILTLAETLAGQFRTEEAIEMFWRAFEKSTDLDGKLGVVTRLTALYLQRNQLDRLLGRLQGEQNESQAQQQRELAICLAQAYAASGDLGMARSELERLLSTNNRDTQLLQQLSKLAEEEGDVEGAAKYQKQLVDVAPSDEGATRLAQLYVRFGDLEEAQALWSRMASAQKETHRVLQAIDSLLANDKAGPVLEITESMVRKDPRDWEALYRQGVALASLSKPEEAVRRFRTLLDLKVDEDEKSAIIKARIRDPKLQAAGARPSSTALVKPSPLEERISAGTQIRMATKLESREYYVSSRTAAAIWSPPDFGQARMAALGWIVSLAQKEGKPKEEAVLAAFRAAKDRTPPDPRAHWDWYLICLVRNDYRGAYEAGRDLSRAAPSDPTALWAYLNSLGSRQQGMGIRYSVAPGSENNDGTPPLAADELEHALSCYRGLKQRRPEMIQGTILNNLAVELKRAKRAEEDDRFYREALEGAEQLPQVASVFGLAAQRGDVEGLIRLFDKYERLQAGKGGNLAYSTGTFYFRGTADGMSRGMSVRAAAKAYDDVLRLLDHALAAARRRNESRPPGAGRAGRYGSQYPVGYTPYYQIWVGKTQRQFQIAFPLPNEYHDAGSITILRTAYELFKNDDLSSDLTAHFRKQAEAARNPSEALYPRLALSYLAWWDDDKDTAISEFARAAEATKAESETRLVLAELHEKRGEPSDALALVDMVEPLDNATMQRREEQALRLAVLTGNLDRARQAAERLFGLRLDTETQVRLAGQMHQLGMHEMAEAVLGRARRRAGGKASALVGLMLQYQRQDKMDVAVQVALQILRGTTAVRNSNPNMSSSDNPDAARSSAIQILARSGRIKAMIARVEEQLERTPKAFQLHQALADYYKADGQRERARAQLSKVAELRPDDANLRLQVANQLLQDGQAAEAIPHFKAALKKSPVLLGNGFYQLQNAFRQANKMDELVQLLDEVDIRSIGQPYYVMDLIQTLSYEEGMTDKVMPLFRKAWEAFPQQRMDLLSYIRRDEFWQMPETYEYARQALLPDPSTYSPANQWYTFQSVLSYSGDGRINSTISRMLDLAASQGKLEGLTGEVEAALAKLPNWGPGKATLALIRCRAGKYDEAKALVNDLLGKIKDQPISSSALWVIGNELENYAATRDLATSLYESCLTGEVDDPYTLYQYSMSPIRRLVSLYEHDDRQEDVRRVLLELAKPRDFSNYPQDYIEQMRMQGLTMAAQQLVKSGYAAEAVPIFSEALAISEGWGSDQPNYIGNLEGVRKQASEGLTATLEGLDGDQLVRTLRGLIRPRPEADEKGATKGGTGRAKRDQAVDLVLLIHPRELDKSAVKSLFAESVAACARVPDELATVTETLGGLRAQQPDDLSVGIAAALAALAGKDRERSREALEALDRLVTAKPLEPLADGARANARQRAEAARLLPLWVIARACRDVESAREFGDRFSDLALEAAGRQSDNRWTMAMLRERGQYALERGDRGGAEAAWGSMLDRIIARESGRNKKKAGPPANPAVPPPASGGTSGRGASLEKPAIRRVAYQAPARIVPEATKAASRPAPAPARAPATGASSVPILTLDRFEQAMQVARLAAEHGLFPLSFRAVRESLEGGPPVVVVANQDRQRMMVSSSGSNEPPDQVTPKVIARLVELEGVWQRKRAPEDQVYEVLRAAAMPAGRPAEVLLYAQPLNPATVQQPRSLGAMLAAWAVRSGKADDLRGKIEARRVQPMAELPCAVLTAQLEMAAGASGPANAALQAVGERLRRNTLRTSSELACNVALPALKRPETRATALSVLELCLTGFQGFERPETLPALLTVMARSQLENGDLEGGRKRLDAYLASVDTAYQRYGGDYPVYQRKQAIQTVATEFARAGYWSDSLEALGRYMDAPTSSNYGETPLTGALVPLVRQLENQPARVRYEALKAWTLPTPTRRVVRMPIALRSLDEPPPVFSEGTRGERKVRGEKPDAVSTEVAGTAPLLVASAVEAGTIDDLAAASAVAVQEKVENAEALHSLVEVARGKTAELRPRIEARIDALVKETAEWAEPNSPVSTARAANPRKPLTFPWTDYLLVRTVLRQGSAELREPGLRLAELLIKRANINAQEALLPWLRSDIAIATAAREGSKVVPTQTDGGLDSWHPASYRKPYTLGESSAASWWVASQGFVSHLAGPDQDFLLLDPPLAGSYEFSVDSHNGPSARGGITLNGLVIEPAGGNNNGLIFPVGASETITSPWKLIRDGGYDRLTVQVTPERVRYLVNGHLFHQDDDPSPTSPWLGLYSIRGRQSTWCNLAIKGEPTFPREVRLSHEDRLEGWISSFYNETQPTRRTTQSVDENGNTTSIPRTTRRGTRGRSPAAPAVNPDDFDWSAKDGVIHGRRLTTSNPVALRGPANAGDSITNQSRLYYFRPLRDGDVLSYEFFWEPDQVMVHPSMDRLAFLLEPDGVRLHWMTAGGMDATGLPADNAAEEPENRLGPARLPLKPGDWNSLTVSLVGDAVTLELNGQAVYRRAIEPTNGRQFGLYHDKAQTSARVRNVVLRGQWPGSLPGETTAGLAVLSRSAQGTQADRRTRNLLIGEPSINIQAEEVLRRARALRPETRYALLADWVLPGADHSAFRLHGDFTPTNPVAAEGSTNDTKADPAGPTRIFVGGELQSPALELVDTAQGLGKLDELAALVEGTEAGDDTSRRSQLALGALIQIARGEDAKAGTLLTALQPLLEKVPDDQPSWARWPELVASARALRRPELRKQALALLETMAAQAQKQKPTSPSPIQRPGASLPGTMAGQAQQPASATPWELKIKNMLARGQRHSDPATESGALGADPGVAHWAAVTHASARTRGTGEPIPAWSHREGQFTHEPGHADDMVYFGVPLRGDFQVDCELTAPKGREIRVSFGGQTIGPKDDLKTVERSHYGRPLPATSLSPPLEKLGEWYKYRLVVKGGMMTSFVDGRQVSQAPTPADSDPWLALLSPASATGSARGVKISGQPTVPETLNLSSLPDLTGWLADEYGDSTTGDTPDWDRRGDEIVGRRREEIPGSKQESVLRYHRPMLEDGEFAYEFYHEPGEVMAHPAMDRLAFLIEPDGVKIHRLTDAQYERTGLAADNASVEPDCRRGPASPPLKIKAWNRVVLSLAGDRVSLRLNGELLYERSLEPTNQRLFGLFHYADETEARVRNVTYRGQWPRTLPPSSTGTGGEVEEARQPAAGKTVQESSK